MTATEEESFVNIVQEEKVITEIYYLCHHFSF